MAFFELGPKSETHGIGFAMIVGYDLTALESGVKFVTRAAACSKGQLATTPLYAN
jgi:hypothetical protein